MWVDVCSPAKWLYLQQIPRVTLTDHQMADWKHFCHIFCATLHVCTHPCAVCWAHTTAPQALLQSVYFLKPSFQCFIDLDGPVGMVLTADRTIREPAISQIQPAHYPQAHDNSCLVPAQGQGCDCTEYVMSRGGGEQWREGFYRDVSQCIIVHRANRQPVTRSGWGPLLTDWNILVRLPGGATRWGLEDEALNCGVLWWNITKHKCCMCWSACLSLISANLCWHTL